MSRLAFTTVVGEFDNPDTSDPHTGAIIFTPAGRIASPDDKLILTTHSVTCPLNNDGTFSQALLVLIDDTGSMGIYSDTYSNTYDAGAVLADQPHYIVVEPTGDSYCIMLDHTLSPQDLTQVARCP